MPNLCNFSLYHKHVEYTLSCTLVCENPSFFFVAPVQVWLQYQCLWDMQAENIYNRLGEDLTKWQALLVQIRKARGTFDNAETRKEFGPVVIDYGKVILAYSSRCCIRIIFFGGEIIY